MKRALLYSSMVLAILLAVSCKNSNSDSDLESEEYYDDTEFDEDPNEEYNGTEEILEDGYYTDEMGDIDETTGLEKYQELINQYTILLKAAGKNISESTSQQLESILSQIKILEGTLETSDFSIEEEELFESLKSNYQEAMSSIQNMSEQIKDQAEKILEDGEVSKRIDEAKDALSTLKGTLDALDLDEE